MTRYILLWFLILSVGCSNEPKDSIEKADSTNKARLDTNTISTGNPAIETDKATAEFLVKAADGSMLEVELGKMAVQKAMAKRVKNLGNMLVTDHSDALYKIKNISRQRFLVLPEGTGDKNTQRINRLNEQKVPGFDKAYIEMMIKDHQANIKEFEKAAGNIKDTTVITFTNKTLPVLHKHLDSCIAIEKWIQ